MTRYLVASAFLASLAASPASAALLDFSWVSSRPSENFSFQLESEVIPHSRNAYSAHFILPGITSPGGVTQRITFYNFDEFDAGFTTYTDDPSEIVASARGLQLFSGTTSLLQFAPGVFQLQGSSPNRGSGTFTIAAIESAVPEPASWAMFIGGFGLIGGAMRRRQRVAVRFA